MAQSSNRQFRKGATACQVLQGLDLSHKTFVITGANTGIGFETARALALQNGHVVLACKNMAKASEVRDLILDDKETAKVDIMHLDCSELQSCEEFARAYTSRGWPIHCLILNAGVVNPPHRVTDDGFETTYQVNHLAQFYLTQLLMPVLLASAPARLVVVASEAYKQCFNLQPNELTWGTLSPCHKNKLNNALKAYALSKLCNILFANEMHRRYSSQGISTYSLHPGVVRTDIGRNFSIIQACVGCCRPFTLTSEQGAASSVFCAAVPGLEERSGGYFIYCKPVRPFRCARNEASAQKLWQLSEEMLEYYKRSIAKQENFYDVDDDDQLNGSTPISP